MSVSHHDAEVLPDDRVTVVGTSHNYLTPQGKAYLHEVTAGGTVDVHTPGLKITVFRLLAERARNIVDVSYIHGELNGKPCRVTGVPYQFNYYGWKGQLVRWGIEEGLHIKNLGFFDAVSMLVA